VLSRPAAASSSLFFADALFSQLGLDTRLWKALASAHMSRLTLVQQAAIPHMLQGANVLVQAKTGSGKTLAYAIPLVQQILLQQVRRARHARRCTRTFVGGLCRAY
jgi:superfamily II DNA/RNA helicase